MAWLKHGDKNTKFFHLKASQRRRRNHIQRIKILDGVWMEEEEEIVVVVTNYFDSLFNAGTCPQIDDCLSTVPHKLTPEMQQTLISEFTAEEIKAALFQMGPTKAPGPDGMNALFLQNFWHVVGTTIVNVVLDYFNFGIMVPAINHTHIVLIPKIKSPEKTTDF